MWRGPECRRRGGTEETGAESHRHSDKCRGRDWQWGRQGRQKKKEAKEEVRNTGDPGARHTRWLWGGPGDGSEPLQPWRDRNSLSGPGLGGVLQEGFAPGSLAFRLEVLPPAAGLSPLICEVGVTILSPHKAFLTTQPQAALPVVSLSHGPDFLCAEHFALLGSCHDLFTSSLSTVL